MTTTLIKERPILFSGAMVRALLDGTKTQTRRAVKSPTGYFNVNSTMDGQVCGLEAVDENENYVKGLLCPYGKPGDRLWVRETFLHTGTQILAATGQPGYVYRAESNQFEGWDGQWKPSIFMPRAASRLLLEIVSVRVERLQDISEADAVAEGVRVVEYWQDDKKCPHYENYLEQMRFEQSPADSYRSLWKKINGPNSWAANPWVWVVEFKVIDGKEAVSC